MGSRCGTQCQSSIQTEQEIWEQQPSNISLKGKFKKVDTTQDMSQFSNLQIQLPIAHHHAPQKRQCQPINPAVRLPTNDSSFQEELQQVIGKQRVERTQSTFINSKRENQQEERKRKKQFDDLMQQRMSNRESSSPRKRKHSQPIEITKLDSPSKAKRDSPSKKHKEPQEVKRHRKYSDQPIPQSKQYQLVYSPPKQEKKPKIKRQKSSNSPYFNQFESCKQNPKDDKREKPEKADKSFLRSQPPSPTPILKRRESEENNSLSPRKKNVRFQEGRLKKGRSGVNY